MDPLLVWGLGSRARYGTRRQNQIVPLTSFKIRSVDNTSVLLYAYLALSEKLCAVLGLRI